MTAALRSPSRLVVLYDPDCPLCVRCRHWLELQSTYVELEFAAANAPDVLERLAPHVPWVGYELVALSERGEAWVGPAAFLVCLWATKQYREWSYRLSGPALAPLAERFFHLVSSRRQQIGRRLGPGCPDGGCRHRR